MNQQRGVNSELHSFMQKSAIQLYKKNKKSMREEIDNAISQRKTITKLTDKGLLASILAELLLREFKMFSVKVNRTKRIAFPQQEVMRKRKQNENPDDPGKTKKNSKKNPGDNKQISIQQISNESLASRKHMELMGRAPFNNNPEEIGVKERDQNMELQTDNFTEQISMLEQQLALQRAQQDDGMMPLNQQTQNLNHDNENSRGSQNQDSSNTSSSQNSKQRFGQIPKFNERIRFLGLDSSQKSTIKRVRNINANRTMNKNTKKAIVDKDLDLTMASLRDVSRQQEEAFEYFKNKSDKMKSANYSFEFVLDVNQKVQMIYNDDHMVKRLLASKKVNKPSAQGEMNYQHDPSFGQYGNDVDFQTTHNFESKNTYDNKESIFQHEMLDTDMFSQNKLMSFTHLKSISKQSKHELFQNLLWNCQLGKIHLTQEKPENFGQIFIEKIRQEVK